MKKIGKAIGASALAGAVIVGGLFAGSAVFAAGSKDKQAQTTKGSLDRLLAKVVHGEGTWTLLDGSTIKLSGDIGQITAVKDGTVTLKREDGTSVSVPTDSSTCVRHDGAMAAVGDLKVGDRAIVAQRESGIAIGIRAGTPGTRGDSAQTPAGRPALRDLPSGCWTLRSIVHGDLTVTYVDGTTKQLQFDRGMISSLAGGNVTLLRRDGASVSIAYDGSTHVLLDCEPASASDLKVGQLAAVISENGHADRISALDGLRRMASADGTGAATAAQ